MFVVVGDVEDDDDFLSGKSTGLPNLSVMISFLDDPDPRPSDKGFVDMVVNGNSRLQDR